MQKSNGCHAEDLRQRKVPHEPRRAPVVMRAMPLAWTVAGSIYRASSSHMRHCALTGTAAISQRGAPWTRCKPGPNKYCALRNTKEGVRADPRYPHERLYNIIWQRGPLASEGVAAQPM